MVEKLSRQTNKLTASNKTLHSSQNQRAIRGSYSNFGDTVDARAPARPAFKGVGFKHSAEPSESDSTIRAQRARARANAMVCYYGAVLNGGPVLNADTGPAAVAVTYSLLLLNTVEPPLIQVPRAAVEPAMGRAREQGPLKIQPQAAYRRLYRLRLSKPGPTPELKKSKIS
jgi:hypothetical protein